MPLSLISSDQESDWYARQAARPGGTALVLGCADGRVAFALSRRGLDVVGVESSPRLLELAEARRREEGQGPRFLQADLRALQLDRTFDAVVAPQNALGLMVLPADVDGFLATVRRHLGATATFLFDVRGVPVAEAHGFELSGRQAFLPHLHGRPGGAVRRFRRHQLDPVTLDAALHAAGLEARERYGDFLGRPWDEHDALQVVVAGVRR